MKPYPIPDGEADRLAALRALNILDTPREDSFDRLVNLARRLFDVPIAAVSLIDADRQWFKSCVGLEAVDTPRNLAFCTHAIMRDEIFVVPDAAADPRFADNPFVTDEPGIRFYAGAPLLLSSGHRIGTLCIIDTKPRDGFGAKDGATLTDLARLTVEKMEAGAEARFASPSTTDTLLDLFIQNAPVPIAMFDREMRYVAASRRWYTDYGLDRLGITSLIGRSHYDIFTDIPERWREMHRRCLGGETDICEEDRYDRSDGTVFWLRREVHPWHYPDGAIGGIIMFTEICNERKLAQEQFRQAKESAEQLLNVVQTMIVVLDRRGVIEIVNRKACEILGGEMDQIVGRNWFDTFVSDATRDSAIEQHQAAMDGEASPPEYFEAEVVTLDGRRRTIGWHTTVRSDEAGRPIGKIRSGEDVTDARAVEAQLRQAQKMEAVGQLTGGIAHDFNNILGIIIGNLDLLLETTEATPEAVTLANAALEASLRASELNQRLLAFARKQPLKPELLDVNETVSDLTRLLRRSLGERVQLSLHLGNPVWPATIDRAQMEASLINLAVNARDAMPAGGALSVETANVALDAVYSSLHPEVAAGDYVCVAVTDTGIGMSAETLARAFDPFFTTKEVGKGNGLGLSMVHGFVKQSNGHVTIYSEPGRGTTIRMYFPRGTDAAAEIAKPMVAQPLAPAKGESILVVEDNEELRRVAVKLLRDLGYHVVETGTADTAIELLQHGWSGDLVFSDVVMPGRADGLDLARLIRREFPSLPVILTSGFAERAAVYAKCDENDEAIDFPMLEKPYRREVLAKAVEAALQERA